MDLLDTIYSKALQTAKTWTFIVIMDVLVIYSPFHSYKTQFIWMHGLLLPAVICTPAKKVSVPFRRIMWWQFRSVSYRMRAFTLLNKMAENWVPVLMEKTVSSRLICFWLFSLRWFPTDSWKVKKCKFQPQELHMDISEKNETKHKVIHWITSRASSTINR